MSLSSTLAKLVKLGEQQNSVAARSDIRQAATTINKCRKSQNRKISISVVRALGKLKTMASIAILSTLLNLQQATIKELPFKCPP